MPKSYPSTGKRKKGRGPATKKKALERQRRLKVVAKPAQGQRSRREDSGKTLSLDWLEKR